MQLILLLVDALEAQEPVTLSKVGVWVKLGELLLIHCSAELATRE